ncbi:MAG: hypothetical protein CL927_09960 [Deltaproteobacteria bacterium]|nr:hypothetical protein [Deltaproteobacteria bacterium]
MLGEWMPPNNLGSVAFSAGAEGGETRTSVSVERGIAVVDGSVSPTAFTGAKRDITFTGTALGPDNSPIADTIGVRVPKGTVLARPARRGTTTTARARRHPNDETVVMVVQPPGSVDAEPVHAVLPWMVSVDDESILLRVAVVDALGRAIVKVPVSLSNTVGESEDLPETVTTDGYGMATILLAKPSDTLGVQVEAQGHRASVVWTRSGASVVGGDPTWLALASDWTRAAPTFVINATPSTAPPPATVDAQEQEQEVASASPSLPAQPKQTSSARSSQSPAWLRGGLAVQGAAYSLAITNSDPTAGPLSVTVDDGVNLAGVQGYVLGWLSQGSLGLELDARYLRGELATQQVFSDSALDLSAEDFDPDSDPDAVLETLTGSGDSIEYDVSDIDVRAGLRYRLPSKGPLTAFGLAQGQYQVARLYLWEDAVVEPIEVPLFGLRGGGGLMVEAGPVWADVQVAASFAPYPIRTEVDGRLHIQVRDPFSIHLGGGQAWRNMAYEVDSAAIAYHDELTYFSVGIGTGLR